MKRVLSYLILINLIFFLFSCKNDTEAFKESKLATNSSARIDTLFEKNPLFFSYQWDKMEPFENKKRLAFTGYYDSDKLISLSLELVMPHPDSVESGNNNNLVKIRNSRVQMLWPADSFFVYFPVDGDKIINQRINNLDEIIEPDSLFTQIIKAGKNQILPVFQKHYRVSDGYLARNLKFAVITKQLMLFTQLNEFPNAGKIIKNNYRMFYSLFAQIDTNLDFYSILNAKYGYNFNSFPLAVVHDFFQQAISAGNFKMADQIFKIRRYPKINSKEFKKSYFTAIQKNSLYMVKKFYQADPDIEKNLIDHTKIMRGIFGRSSGEENLSPLCIAAFYGNLDILKFYYDKNPTRLSVNKALACAAYNNKPKTAEFLLQKKANPEVQYPEESAVGYARITHKKTSQIYKLLTKYSINE